MTATLEAIKEKAPPEALKEEENFVPDYENAELRIEIADEDNTLKTGGEVVSKTKPVETPKADETVTPETPKPSVHSADVIAQAVRLDIPSEEIEEMTPAELKLAVRMATRNAAQIEALKNSLTHAPKVEPKIEEDFFAGIDKATLLPEVVGPMEKMAEKLKKLEAENQAIKQGQTASSLSAVQMRVNGVLDKVSPGISKQFDPSTPQGQKMESALYRQLGTLFQIEAETGKPVSEDVRVKRALAALDMLPVADPKAEQEAKKKADFEKDREAYDAGALAKPVNRKPAESIIDKVQEILDADRKRASGKNPETEYKVKFND